MSFEITTGYYQHQTFFIPRTNGQINDHTTQGHFCYSSTVLVLYRHTSTNSPHPPKQPDREETTKFITHFQSQTAAVGAIAITKTLYQISKRDEE